MQLCHSLSNRGAPSAIQNTGQGMPRANRTAGGSISTPIEALRQSMAGIISNHVPKAIDSATPIPHLSFFRRDEPAEPCYCQVEPNVVLVVQGAKQMLVGGASFRYDPNTFLITSLELPANSGVLEASPKVPCLGLWLTLDLQLMAELIAQGHVPAPKERSAAVSAGIGSVTQSILEPFKRLLDLINEPEAIEVMAPLIKREIHYRLMTSDQAPLLRQIASVDSKAYRIAKVIDWLKTHYAAQVRVEELATRAQMSPPTFHQHFRLLTAMSPLQYQKWLRLSEAKRLMLNDHVDAATAAFRVGYESPSQFSREYSRMYGNPPRRDIELTRQHAVVSG